jgi:hypothetical protein
MSNLNHDKSIFIECECHSEGLGIDYDSDDGYYYFSYWSRGFRNGKLPFWQRLRYILHLAFTGKPFNDELVLNRDSSNKLCEFLKDIELNKLESEYGKSSKS